MPYILSAQDSNKPVNLYYEDMGAGKTIVFIHGWPLSGSMWEYQITQLPQKGVRCITYDRRGFGKSDRPYTGYDYKTLAGDLKSLLDELELTDVTLVGFSMGGGEIATYFSLFGGARVAKVILISAVVPFLLKTADNPDGVPQEHFDKNRQAMMDNRPDFIEQFNKDFYRIATSHQPVSETYLSHCLTTAMDASPVATIECAKSFSSTDFRQDIKSINVPTLIIHGDKDKTVPIELTAKKAVKEIPGAELKIYEGAPHGLWFTHKEKLNEDILSFISGDEQSKPVIEKKQYVM